MGQEISDIIYNDDMRDFSKMGFSNDQRDAIK